MNQGEALPRNIVLIGFMGCGKTTIGKRLARMLGYPFVDTDQIIEVKTSTTIAEIFETRGEAYFRQLEAAVLQELAAPDAPRRIVATGGGIVGRRQNRILLRQLGYVVWLQAPVAVIEARTSRNSERPLLAKNSKPRQKIERLLAARTPLYHEIADLELDTTELDTKEIACGILESARYYFAP